jgi:hypothetical protein
MLSARSDNIYRYAKEKQTETEERCKGIDPYSCNAF